MHSVVIANASAIGESDGLAFSVDTLDPWYSGDTLGFKLQPQFHGHAAGASTPALVNPNVLVVTSAPAAVLELALVAAALLNAYSSTPPAKANRTYVAVSLETDFGTSSISSTNIVGDITCSDDRFADVSCQARVDPGYSNMLVLLVHEFMHALGFTSKIDGFVYGQSTISGGHWDTQSPPSALMRAVLPASGARLWAGSLAAVGLSNHCISDGACAPGTCDRAGPLVGSPGKCSNAVNLYTAPNTKQEDLLPDDYSQKKCKNCAGSAVALIIVGVLFFVAFVLFLAYVFRESGRKKRQQEALLLENEEETTAHMGIL